MEIFFALVSAPNVLLRPRVDADTHARRLRVLFRTHRKAEVVKNTQGGRRKFTEASVNNKIYSVKVRRIGQAGIENITSKVRGFLNQQKLNCGKAVGSSRPRCKAFQP